ncbi:unnamed protein product [Parnassius mnemosyne]|uniref:Uncharacterized protein n=1 Tax=Parnassius mnemosyne TaxID=213953 RepID=A0AAV1M6M7_9NEOP
MEKVLTDDEIDDDKVNKLLDQWEKDYPKEKPMVIRARKECLDGKYREYISKHDCIESKLYDCVFVNVLVDCQSWREDAECAEVKEHAQKCKDAQDME